jgi:predicted nuclease of predicted toxin-antitoxin system
VADGKVVCGWLLDQNVPAEICGWLASLKLGIEAYHARDLGLGRASDDEIFRAAQERDCTILTFDEDFADQRVFPLGSHAGVIRLRVWPTTVAEITRALARLFAEVSPGELRGALTIVDRERIRIRSPS